MRWVSFASLRSPITPFANSVRNSAPTFLPKKLSGLVPVKLDKITDVKRHLAKHFGKDWDPMEGLKYYYDPFRSNLAIVDDRDYNGSEDSSLEADSILVCLIEKYAT